MAADEGGEVARTRSRRPDRGAFHARGGASAAGGGHDQQCADGLPLAGHGYQPVVAHPGRKRADGATVAAVGEGHRGHAGGGRHVQVAPTSGDGGSGEFVDLDRPAAPVEQHQAVAGTGAPAVQRAFEEAVAQFHLAGGEAALDAAGGGHGEGQALPAVGFGEAGDVDHAEHLAVLRGADDGGGAGPALDAGAVVLGGVDLHRLPDGEARRRYRSSCRRRRCPSPVPVIVGLPLLSPCLLGLDRHRFRSAPGNAGFPAGHLATPVPVAVRGAQVIERK